MKLTRFSTNYNGRSKSTVFAVWDSFRDMLEYNKLRMTMCSQYTTDLVSRFYDKRDVGFDARDIEWFGTKNVEDALEDVWTFINTGPLNLSLENFNNMTVNVTTVGFSQKKKLNLNDLYRGVFSFDLAAPYLYHKRTFYSPLFGQEVGLEKVVSEGIEPNLKFYYADEPKHELDRRGVFDSEGNKVFSSTYDRAKCYIDLPKPKRDKFTVDLFCLTTFNANIKASELVWNALAVNAISNTIINAGIELRIWCVTPLEIEMNNNMLLLTRMKDYQESLDTNSIAIACADPRFYRLHTFRARSYAVDEIGEPRLMDSGMGRSVGNTDYARSAIFDLFEREQMWDDEQNQIIYKENKIFLNVCLSEDAGKREFKRVIDYFEMFAEWKQIGQSATIEKFEMWYKGSLKNTMSFSEYLEKYP